MPANANYCFRLKFCLADELQGDLPITAVLLTCGPVDN